MNIAEFLLARIAEDEAVASCVSQFVGPDGYGRPLYRGIGPRVLAECAAKRAIVETYEGAIKASDMLDEMGAWEALAVSKAAAVATEGALRALAAVYADHPDYDQAWRVA